MDWNDIASAIVKIFNSISWNFVLSIVTACTASIAIFQTSKQTKLSNKQHLFDRRLENYSIVLGLIELYEKHEYLPQKNDTLIFDSGIDYTLLTNNTYLESISMPPEKLTEDPNKRGFLIKMEDLKLVARNTQFIFDSASSNYLKKFVLDYQDLLFKLYEYGIVLTAWNEKVEKFNCSNEEGQKMVKEPQSRKKLLNSFRKLEESHKNLVDNKVMEKVEKQIKF